MKLERWMVDTLPHVCVLVSVYMCYKKCPYSNTQVSLWCVYPFLVLEIARLVFLTTSFVIAMLLVKENIADLGLLGGFVLCKF